MRKHRRMEEHCQSKTRYSLALSAFTKSAQSLPDLLHFLIVLAWAISSCLVEFLIWKPVWIKVRKKNRIMKQIWNIPIVFCLVQLTALKAHLYFEIPKVVHRLFCYKKVIFDTIQVTSLLPFWTTTKSNVTLVHIFLPCHTQFWNPNSTSEVGPSIVCCRNVTGILTEWHVIVSCTRKDALLWFQESLLGYCKKL